jgi:hypothetical protein
MTAEQESILEFRANERAGRPTIYRCCECGQVSKNAGYDMNTIEETGEDICQECCN